MKMPYNVRTQVFFAHTNVHQGNVYPIVSCDQPHHQIMKHGALFMKKDTQAIS